MFSYSKKYLKNLVETQLDSILTMRFDESNGGDGGDGFVFA